MFDPLPILKNLKFIGYYAITLYQRGIAFYATKECPEGTLGKMGEFFKRFSRYVLAFSFLTGQPFLYANSFFLRGSCFSDLKHPNRIGIIFNTLSVRWWAFVFLLLDEICFFELWVLIFFKMFQKPSTLWVGCMWDALPLLDYIQYLRDLPKGNMRILPFWGIYEKELPGN
jgi:hypothetical protein